MDPYVIEYKSIAVSWFLFLTVIAAVVVNFSSRFLLKGILSPEQREDLNFNLLIASIIGARLFYVIINWSHYYNNLSAVFQLSHLTLNLTGALLGGGLILFYFTWQEEVDFWQVISRYFNLVSISLIIGSWIYYFEGQFSVVQNLLLSLFWALTATIQYLLLDYKNSEKYVVILFLIVYGLIRVVS